MYALKYRKEMGLMQFPGRIPFVQNLWQCLRQYCINMEHEMDTDWDMVAEKIERIEVIEWGHYNEELQEWVRL